MAELGEISRACKGKFGDAWHAHLILSGFSSSVKRKLLRVGEDLLTGFLQLRIRQDFLARKLYRPNVSLTSN